MSPKEKIKELAIDFNNNLFITNQCNKYIMCFEQGAEAGFMLAVKILNHTRFNHAAEALEEKWNENEKV